MSTKPELPTYTVGYAIRGSKFCENEEVLLRLGTDGKLIGFGGKVKPSDKSEKAAFIREFRKKIGRPNTVINPRNVRLAASVEVRRENGKTFLLKVFLLSRYRGHSKNTREIRDARWYPARDLPENVLPSDPVLFRRILDDRRLVTGWLLYTAGKKTVLKDYGLEQR